ncbi:hypothetical protein RYX36_006269 [Vicia faba]
MVFFIINCKIRSTFRPQRLFACAFFFLRVWLHFPTNTTTLLMFMFGLVSGSSNSNKNTSSNYQNVTGEPSYFSSSIHYGGQENYSSRNRTTESHHVLKKDKNHGDLNGINSNSASRGDWWEGSLYY